MNTANNNVNFNANNTKKELLNIIARLKKSEIISMIDNYNNVNNKNEDNINKNNDNANIKNIKVEKKKIIPKNLNKIRFNNKRKNDNEFYQHI